MRRIHLLSVAAAMAVTAAMMAAPDAWLAPAPDGSCFSSGGTAYRLTASTKADYTIRIDNGAQHPDLVVQITDDPAAADLVLLADGDGLSGCAAGALRTIRLDPRAAEPDITIALTGEANAQPRIYAPGFRAEEAAALFAVMRKTPRKRIASR